MALSFYNDAGNEEPETYLTKKSDLPIPAFQESEEDSSHSKALNDLIPTHAEAETDQGEERGLLLGSLVPTSDRQSLGGRFSILNRVTDRFSPLTTAATSLSKDLSAPNLVLQLRNVLPERVSSRIIRTMDLRNILSTETIVGYMNKYLPKWVQDWVPESWIEKTVDFVFDNMGWLINWYLWYYETSKRWRAKIENLPIPRHLPRWLRAST